MSALSSVLPCKDFNKYLPYVFTAYFTCTGFEEIPNRVLNTVSNYKTSTNSVMWNGAFL